MIPIKNAFAVSIELKVYDRYKPAYGEFRTKCIAQELNCSAVCILLGGNASSCAQNLDKTNFDVPD